MKHCNLFFLFLFISILTKGQTTSEMTNNARKSFQSAENELDSVYQVILKNYEGDSIFIESLKTAQTNWSAFVQSEMTLKYPYPRETYGSLFNLCLYSYKETLYLKRLSTLKDWVIGVEPGDACSGSLPDQYSAGPGTITKITNYEPASLMNGIEGVQTFKTEKLGVKFFEYYNRVSHFPFQEGFYLIAVSDLDSRTPKQSLFSLAELSSVEVSDFNVSDPANPLLTISYDGFSGTEEMTLKISSDKIEWQ
jgi:hypothetical protein